MLRFVWYSPLASASAHPRLVSAVRRDGVSAVPSSRFPEAIMAERVAIFIDGAYLDYVLKDELGAQKAF